MAFGTELGQHSIPNHRLCYLEADFVRTNCGNPKLTAYLRCALTYVAVLSLRSLILDISHGLGRDGVTNQGCETALGEACQAPPKSKSTWVYKMNFRLGLIPDNDKPTCVA
jgi:hypothetical protein